MIQPADHFESREITFLWRRRFPLGTLSLIAGRPGSGKSQVALLMASELSHQGLVSVISNPEDDLSEVVKPRLDAQRGKHSLIYLANPEELIVLPGEMDRLEELIRESGASLLVLDPIGAHFEPESSLHRRSVLRKLVGVATRTRCAIVGVHHTVKRGGELLGQVGGSMGGLVGSCRAVYMFGPNGMRGYAEERRGDSDRYALQCLKINGIEAPPALLFDRISVEIEAGIEAPRLRVAGQTFGLPTESVAEMSEWLTKYLAAGQDCHRLHGEIRIEGQRAGFSWAQLQNVGSTLGFLNFNGKPHWQLPTDHPLRDAQQRPLVG